MDALIISRVQLLDADHMKTYAAAAARTMASHGGEVVNRCQFVEALLGEGASHTTGVMRFPSLEAARAWFASPEYQALKDLREKAGKVELFLYQTL